MHELYSSVDIRSFLGLRKITVVYVIVFLLLLTWATTVFQIYQIQHIADRNAHAAAALCAFRQDLVDRRDNTEAFLALSIKQRIQKYGRGIGRLDPAVLQNQLNGQNRTIAALDSLRCH